MVVDIYFNHIKETSNQRIDGTSPVTNKMVFENGNKKAKVMSKKEEPLGKRYTGGRIKLKCKNCGEMIANHHYAWHMEVCKQFFKHIRKIGKENWQCKICSKEVKKRLSLNAHLRQKHPDEVSQNKNVSKAKNLNSAENNFLENDVTNVDHTNKGQTGHQNQKKIKHIKNKHPQDSSMDIKKKNPVIKNDETKHFKREIRVSLQRIVKNGTGSSQINQHIKGDILNKMNQNVLAKVRKKNLMHFETENKELKTIVKKCKHCKKRIRDPNHVIMCEMYSKLIVKSGKKYKCQLCQVEKALSYIGTKDTYSQMCYHVKVKHSEEINRQYSDVKTQQISGNRKGSEQINEHVNCKKQCPHCCKVFLPKDENFRMHVRECEIYSKYIQTVSDDDEDMKDPNYNTNPDPNPGQKPDQNPNQNPDPNPDPKSDPNPDPNPDQEPSIRIQKFDNQMFEKCKYCKEDIACSVLSKHIDLIEATRLKLNKHQKICKRYYKYFKRNGSEYECMLCPGIHTKNRTNMHYHIKTRHKRKTFVKNDKEKKPTIKFTCEHCNKVIYYSINYLRHTKICRIFNKFIKNTSTGFSCLICLDQETVLIRNMYKHIREKHSDDLNFKKNQKEMEKIDTIEEVKPLIFLNNIDPSFSSNDIGSENKMIEIKPSSISPNTASCERTQKNQLGQQNISERGDHSTLKMEKSRTKCKHCNKSIWNNVLSKHVKACQLYSKFFKKTQKGFKCLLCSSKNFTTKGRYNMHQHIRKDHRNDDDFKKNKEDVERSENPNVNIFSETSNDNTEQEKTHIDRGQLFQENDTESQRVLECFHCGGDYVNEIHETFCRTASKYVMENTCLICDAEGDSPHDAVKHVRENHLNVICEFIEDEISEKSKDIIGINFKSQNQEESPRDDNETLSQHETEDLRGFNEETLGETQAENNTFNERSLHSQIEIGDKTISEGDETPNIEEMKVAVIKFEPNVPEKDQSSIPNLHPENQKQIDTESHEKAIQEHTLKDFAIVNQDFENEQSTPEIPDKHCLKEQAEDQLDLELDGMEILPHD